MKINLHKHLTWLDSLEKLTNTKKPSSTSAQFGSISLTYRPAGLYCTSMICAQCRPKAGREERASRNCIISSNIKLCPGCLSLHKVFRLELKFEVSTFQALQCMFSERKDVRVEFDVHHYWRNARLDLKRATGLFKSVSVRGDSTQIQICSAC
jgi:hypothetical protein